MVFQGFAESDFDTFHIDGLDARMEAIRTRIQPKFQAIGEALCGNIALLAGNEMFVHIAKHARRTVNPPKDTWLAVCHNKRGYKQYPHFQVGLFDDHVFLWLALIYEVQGKRIIADHYLKRVRTVKRTVPQHYVVSYDHMKKEAVSAKELTEKRWREALERFRDVKKSELLIGRHIAADDPVLQDGQAFVRLAQETFETLMPLYKLARDAK